MFRDGRSQKWPSSPTACSTKTPSPTGRRSALLGFLRWCPICWNTAWALSSCPARTPVPRSGPGGSPGGGAPGGGGKHPDPQGHGPGRAQPPAGPVGGGYHGAAAGIPPLRLPSGGDSRRQPLPLLRCGHHSQDDQEVPGMGVFLEALSRRLEEVGWKIPMVVSAEPTMPWKPCSGCWNAQSMQYGRRRPDEARLAFLPAAPSPAGRLRRQRGE